MSTTESFIMFIWLQRFGWPVRNLIKQVNETYLLIDLPDGPFIYLRPPPRNKNKAPSYESTLAKKIKETYALKLLKN
jgi:hypothetical protein